jgi:phage terminase large subunit
MPLNPTSRTALVNAAQHALDRAQATTTGTCAVLWQRPNEPSLDYARRVVTARVRLPDGRLLVVVCGPNAVPPSRGLCIVELPPVMLGLFDRPARYRCCYGGRGAGRSWAFARALIVKSLERRVRILCAREFQNSIADSIHTLLSDQIEVLGLGQYFEIQATAVYGRNGSEFVFSGVRNNVTRIKSLEGASIAFVEEAAQITQRSWEILIPTIRTAGSEIWAAWNPDLETDPTHERFVMHPPDSAVVVKTDYSTNPWFPEPLQAEMEYLKRVDPDAYAHVWLGGCRKHSDAQIFRNKYTIESFEPQPDWGAPFHGLDLGFAADPSVLTKCWVHENRLYIEREAWQLHCDIDRLPALLNQIPGARGYTIRVDSSRPETVSYLKAHGFPNCTSVDKWPDSVQDGVSRMRAFEQIVLHPRCEHTAEEFRLYSYKQDRLSGDVLPDIVDKHNHAIDSIRYAISPLIKQGGPTAFLSFLDSQLSAEAEAKNKAGAEKQSEVVRTNPVATWHK